MPDDNLVREWLARIQLGDSRATQALWDAFAPWLARVAERSLRGQPRGWADEEDVVVIAMNSFFRGVLQGRFPNLRGRAALRRLLFQITRRKAIDLIRVNHRGKLAVVGESALELFARELGPPINQVPAAPPSANAEEPSRGSCGEWLELLDPTLRELVVLKLQGYTNLEIAHRIDRSVATVERRFRLIRETWSAELGRHAS